MTFGNYGNSVPNQLNTTIGGIALNRAKSCKYLGFIVDYNMKWGKYMESVVKKTNTLPLSSLSCLDNLVPKL